MIWTARLDYSRDVTVTEEGGGKNLCWRVRSQDFGDAAKVLVRSRNISWQIDLGPLG